jgi:sulfotransferase
MTYDIENVEPMDTEAAVPQDEVAEVPQPQPGQDAEAKKIPTPPPLPHRFRSFQQLVCLAGMPRAGASLLSALFSQNPRIYAGGGDSPMCQMMWDTYLSYQDKCNREFGSNNKHQCLPQIVAAIPHVFYQDICGAEIVVDRCRSWTHESNFNLLRGSIDPNIKIIVLERPLREVVDSYARLFTKNHMGSAVNNVMTELLTPNKEPIIRAMDGINWVKAWCKVYPDQQNFLIVSYQDLVSQPQSTLERIYEFCGWITEEHPMFVHDFSKVVVKYPVDETVHGLVGQHKVHPKVAKQTYTETIDWNESVLKKIQEITEFFAKPPEIKPVDTTSSDQETPTKPEKDDAININI